MQSNLPTLVYSSMNFEKCIQSCNHHHDQGTETISSTAKICHALLYVVNRFPTPSPWQPLIWDLSLKFCPV